MKAKFDPADLVMLTKLHIAANPSESESTDDVDDLVDMAVKFRKQFGGIDWENSDLDWVSLLVEAYNNFKPFNWNDYVCN